MTASRKNSSAPPAMSCALVGGASPVGRAADPMTTMLALPAAGSAAWFSLLTASCSAVRSLASSVRVCTLSTVRPGSVASASSLMRRLVCVTSCRSASGWAAVSGVVLSPAICAVKATNCRATWSESCCARFGVSAVPEILMMFPSAAVALASVPQVAAADASPVRGRRPRGRPPTELVAMSVCVRSSRSSHCPRQQDRCRRRVPRRNSEEVPWRPGAPRRGNGRREAAGASG